MADLGSVPAIFAADPAFERHAGEVFSARNLGGGLHTDPRAVGKEEVARTPAAQVDALGAVFHGFGLGAFQHAAAIMDERLAGRAGKRLAVLESARQTLIGLNDVAHRDADGRTRNAARDLAFVGAFDPRVRDHVRGGIFAPPSVHADSVNGFDDVGFLLDAGVLRVDRNAAADIAARLVDDGDVLAAAVGNGRGARIGLCRGIGAGKRKCIGFAIAAAFFDDDLLVDRHVLLDVDVLRIVDVLRDVDGLGIVDVLVHHHRIVDVVGDVDMFRIVDGLRHVDIVVDRHRLVDVDGLGIVDVVGDGHRFVDGDVLRGVDRVIDRHRLVHRHRFVDGDRFIDVDLVVDRDRLEDGDVLVDGDGRAVTAVIVAAIAGKGRRTSGAG